MFFKQKFFPDGTMDKLKAHLVADGILQDPQAVPYVSQQGDLVLLFDRFYMD